MCVFPSALYVFQNARSVSETETQSHYQALLTALEHHCSTLIASMQEAEGEVQQAKQVNDRLFDTFNKVSGGKIIICSYQLVLFYDAGFIVKPWKRVPGIVLHLSLNPKILTMYNASFFKQARVEAAHPKAPKDAKEILKKMPAFF